MATNSDTTTALNNDKHYNILSLQFQFISDPEVASSQSKEIFLCVPAWYEVGCIYKNIIWTPKCEMKLPYNKAGKINFECQVQIKVKENMKGRINIKNEKVKKSDITRCAH